LAQRRQTAGRSAAEFGGAIGQAQALGAISGAVAGLVAILNAAGFVLYHVGDVDRASPQGIVLLTSWSRR